MTLTAASLVQHDAERDEAHVAAAALDAFVEATIPLSPLGRAGAVTALLTNFIESIPTGQRERMVGEMVDCALRLAGPGERLQ